MSLLNLFQDLIKTIKDIHNHPDFNTAAHDVLATATDAVAEVPEVLGDKAALLNNVIGAACQVAQAELAQK